MGQVSLDPPVPMNTWMPEIPLPGMNRMLDLVLCSPGAVLPYSVQHPGISFFSYCSMFTRCSAAIFSTTSRYQFLLLLFYVHQVLCCYIQYNIQVLLVILSASQGQQKKNQFNIFQFVLLSLDNCLYAFQFRKRRRSEEGSSPRPQSKLIRLGNIFFRFHSKFYCYIFYDH